MIKISAESSTEGKIEELEHYIDSYYNNMTPKQKKRGRRHLSDSSESDDLVKDLKEIKTSITNIKAQLQSLDLLKKMSEDVEDLKQSLEFQTALVDVLKQENATLRAEVNDLRQQTAVIRNQSFQVTEEILDLQYKSMRNNVVIHGVPEEEWETHQKTEEQVHTFLTSHLHIDRSEERNIGLCLAHRIGKKQDSKGKKTCRPIVAHFRDHKSKSFVMQQGKELKETQFAISDQFPAEILKRRRLLYPIMKDARNDNKKTRLIVDKLYIEGSLYRNASVTYWLSGRDIRRSETLASQSKQ